MSKWRVAAAPSTVYYRSSSTSLLDLKYPFKWRWTYIKEGFLIDVLRRSHGRRSWNYRLHVSKLDHPFALLVLPALVVSQLIVRNTRSQIPLRSSNIIWRSFFEFRENLRLWIVSFPALTWCLVLSNTNHRGFHGFNKAPFLNRMPSKLLMDQTFDI